MDYRALLGSEPWHDGSGTITYSFITRIPSYFGRTDTDGDGVGDTVDVSGDGLTLAAHANVAMTAAERALVQRAVQALNEVADINLVQGTIAGSTVGDIAFGAGNFGDESLFGFVSDFPGQLGVPSRFGDFWINRDNPDQTGAKLGNTGWQTYLHELGHAIGLHHPNEDPDNEAGDPLNNNKYTMMSYRAHPAQEHVSTAASAWPLTPMMLDIEALQKLYGANMSTRAGATTYFGPAAGTAAAYALANGGKIASGFTAILTVWDAGGIDTISAANQTGIVTINLNPGTFSTIGAIRENIGLARAVTVDGVIVNLIENAVGGSNNDKLFGNAAANSLIGAAGADSLNGAGGNDVLTGGLGADTMSGGAGNDLFILDSVSDKVVEVLGAGVDAVRAAFSYTLGANVENLTLTGTSAANGIGNGLNNLLIGNGAANVLNGMAGADTMRGGAGNDVYMVDHLADKVSEAGGTGIDTVRSSISFTLAAGFENLTLLGSAGLTGRGHGGVNNLTGNNGANLLVGGGGNDVLTGGRGADILEGGLGADRLVYGSAAESTGGAVDTLRGFNILADKIDLAVAVTGSDGTWEGESLSLATFNADLAALFGDVLKASHALFYTPGAGDQAGKTFLIVDGNGIHGYQGGQDYVFLWENTPIPETLNFFI